MYMCVSAVALRLFRGSARNGSDRPKRSYRPTGRPSADARGRGGGLHHSAGAFRVRSAGSSASRAAGSERGARRARLRQALRGLPLPRAAHQPWRPRMAAERAPPSSCATVNPPATTATCLPVRTGVVSRGALSTVRRAPHASRGRHATRSRHPRRVPDGVWQAAGPPRRAGALAPSRCPQWRACTARGGCNSLRGAPALTRCCRGADAWRRRAGHQAPRHQV